MRIRSAALVVGLLAGISMPLRAQSVEGRVFDQDTGRPVASAWIAVLDSASLIEMGRVTTDSQGRFTLTSIPGSFALVVGLEGYSQSSPLYFSLAEDETEEAVIALRTVGTDAIEIVLADDELRPSQGARILGRVIEGRSGKPIVGAEVSLLETGHRTISAGEGVFAFRDISAGTNQLLVSHLSYGERARIFEVQPGGAYEVTIRLDPEAIELEGIDVEVRNQPWARLMDDVYQRMGSGMGAHFLTADDFEIRSFPPLNNALREVPSVRIVQQGAYDQQIVLRGGCIPAIWLDGVEIFNPRQLGSASASMVDLLRAPTTDLEVVEIFPGPATLPPEFARPQTECAIVIWGRR